MLPNIYNYPFKLRRRALCRIGMLAAFAVLLTASTAHALLVQHLELKDLCARAEKVMRVKVLDRSPGSIQAGGGNIPVTTYRLQVTDSLAGAKVGVIDINVVGNLKREVRNGNLQRVDLFSDMPRLEVKKEYLLFTTAPSKAGLVSFVGLGQGCFRVYPQDKKEVAVNELDNKGLGIGSAGPVLYTDLAQRIRQLINR